VTELETRLARALSAQSGQIEQLAEQQSGTDALVEQLALQVERLMQQLALLSRS
jgi:hypothetical protein